MDKLTINLKNTTLSEQIQKITNNRLKQKTNRYRNSYTWRFTFLTWYMHFKTKWWGYWQKHPFFSKIIFSLSYCVVCKQLYICKVSWTKLAAWNMPRYNWNIVETGVKHHKPEICSIKEMVCLQLHWIPHDIVYKQCTCSCYIAWYDTCRQTAVLIICMLKVVSILDYVWCKLKEYSKLATVIEESFIMIKMVP